MKKVDYKKISWETKTLYLFMFLFLLILLTGCAGKMTRFTKPDIKDDFCGPVMNYRYCKCAFHNQFCDELGISSYTANAYVRDEYNKWVAYLLAQFTKDCKEGGGIFHPKYECEYCQLPYIKKGDECINPEEEEEDEEEEKEEETGFKPDGPLDSDCNTTPKFETEWKKYSDIDTRIPVQSRSWEAQGVVKTHEQILNLKVANFQLERDMEIDRQIRLDARAYKNALVKNIKQNLIKATIRLAYTTYKTIESGYNAGQSFKTFLTSTKTLARAGGLLSTVKTLVPKGSKIEIDTKTITGKIANVGIETAYQAMEALGNPKDIAIKFMKETQKVIVPSADLTPEEINILRDQHITKQFVNHAIAESYKDNAKRRAQITANENKIKQLEAEIVAWEAKEKIRVQDMLREACLEQKRKYEDN
jgi:cation transport regulator ChaB